MVFKAKGGVKKSQNLPKSVYVVCEFCAKESKHQFRYVLGARTQLFILCVCNVNLLLLVF